MLLIYVPIIRASYKKETKMAKQVKILIFFTYGATFFHKGKPTHHFPIGHTNRIPYQLSIRSKQFWKSMTGIPVRVRAIDKWVCGGGCKIGRVPLKGWGNRFLRSSPRPRLNTTRVVSPGYESWALYPGS